MPNASFGVDISSFRSGISSAKNEVKTLDQQMKMLNATIKAEGASEATLNQQTQTLNSKMAAQRNIAKQAEAALKAMTQNGVKPSSDAYQRMSRELLAAQTGMMETQAALNDLGDGAVKAAGGVGQLESGLNGISKKISLDQVISGINKITGGLESAAKKAVSLGESLFDAVMDKARLADDNATMALMYGIDMDTFLKMQAMVKSGMDTSVDAILKSQSKLKKGIGEGNKNTMEALSAMGISAKEWQQVSGQSGPSIVSKDAVELFWEAGRALMVLGDEYEKEDRAQALFGRSWHDLVPLFDKYHSLEEFNTALNNMQTISKEDNESLVQMADSFDGLHQKMDTLTSSILAQFAPGLTSLADSLSELLQGVLDYLKTEDGQEMLKGMSESFSSLFDGLREISVEDVVGKFESIFGSIVEGFKWVSENGETLLGVLNGIGLFWAGLKVSEGVLTLLKLVDGLKGLLGAGAAGTTGSGLATGLSTWLMGGAGKVAGMLGNATLQNDLPGVGDWLINQTDVGMWIRGTRTPEETWNELKQNVQENSKTFLTKDNALMRPFIELGENMILYWDQINKTNQTAADWTLSDHLSIEEQMQMINNGSPIPIPTEPEVPSDAAADIAAQIGTVTVYVEPIVGDLVNNTDKRRRNNGIPGYANGITFVPDTRLAWLHPGEEVRAAREVSSRNYSSNLYVEKMVMNNATDARGLADEMAAAQRRTISGFGG